MYCIGQRNNSLRTYRLVAVTHTGNTFDPQSTFKHRSHCIQYVLLRSGVKVKQYMLFQRMRIT